MIAKAKGEGDKISLGKVKINFINNKNFFRKYRGKNSF
jgi:hypothetical protein